MTVRLSTLPSGLRVVTDTMPGLKTAALGLFVAAGSRFEQDHEHGLSHLLEHMAFKGTASRNARDIAATIENVGGDLNAETGVEQTGYFAHVLAEDAELALELLADILCNSQFDNAELEREKNVILQEIGAVEDTPDDLVFDHVQACAFSGQAIGRPILGTRSTVMGFNRDSVAAYLRRHYLAETIVLAAAGDVDHDRLVAKAQTVLASLPQKAAEPPAPALYTGGEHVAKKALEQAHIVVAFPGYAIGVQDYEAAQIFATAIGGGMSSPLFQEVREKRGLAYAIHTFHWSFADAGLFGFYAGCAGKDAGELMRAALDTLVGELDPVAIQRAKAQIKVATLSVWEQPAARAQQLAKQLFAYGRVLTPQESVDRIDVVDKVAIERVSAQILGGKPTIAAVGPVGKVLSSERVAQRLRASS